MHLLASYRSRIDTYQARYFLKIAELGAFFVSILVTPKAGI